MTKTQTGKTRQTYIASASYLDDTDDQITIFVSQSFPVESYPAGEIESRRRYFIERYDHDSSHWKLAGRVDGYPTFEAAFGDIESLVGEVTEI